MTSVAHDSRAFTIAGERVLLLSGAIHYWRSTPGMWPSLLRHSKEAGLNCIETYVFWGAHEKVRGQVDWSGRLDLRHFIELCAKEGLHVVLRIGPYICAEVNFGGFPWWLTEVPGLVTRTDNEPFKHEVRGWVERLMAEVGDLQANRGGPIILAQLENEYGHVQARHGEAGQRYLEWIGNLAGEVGIEVPLIMCEGATAGALPTLNGFDVAGRVPAFRADHPNVPPFWTECWTGWFDNFGQPHHTRDPRELASKVIQFFAAGGTAINYYMWHGGTNFERESMYSGATSYDYDAPLDEFGRPTEKAHHLARLHETLSRHASLVLNYDRREPSVMLPSEGDAPALLGATSWERGETCLWAVFNNREDAFDFGPYGLELELPAGAAALLLEERDHQRVLFESHALGAAGVSQAASVLIDDLSFEEFPEPMGREEHDDPRPSITLDSPSSMLPHTQDRSDYAWYEAVITAQSAQDAVLTCPGVRDLATLWLNGAHVTSRPRTPEQDSAAGSRYEFDVRLVAGENRVRVLVAAIGLINGEWNLEAPMTEERKGLIGGLQVDGVEAAVTWTLTAGLLGEARQAPAGAEDLGWQPLGSARRLRWFRTRFKGQGAGVYAVEVGALFKGLLWVNGHCLGRYWQVPAQSRDTGMSSLIALSGEGLPTQARYHLPADWVADDNTLVVFEETDAEPAGVGVVWQASP